MSCDPCMNPSKIQSPHLKYSFYCWFTCNRRSISIRLGSKSYPYFLFFSTLWIDLMHSKRRVFYLCSYIQIIADQRVQSEERQSVLFVQVSKVYWSIQNTRNEWDRNKVQQFCISNRKERGISLYWCHLSIEWVIQKDLCFHHSNLIVFEGSQHSPFSVGYLHNLLLHC